MGRDKASIEIGGQSLLERTVDVLHQAGAESVRVVLPEGTSPAVAEEIGIVRDKFESAGALAGIHAAVSDCRSAVAFISACDLPFAHAELIRSLLSAMHESQADCAVPEQPDGRLQPLFAAYRSKPAREAAEHILSAEDSPRSANSLVNRLNCRVLRFEEYSGLAGAERMLMNVNTPEELALALKFAEGESADNYLPGI